MRCIYLIAFDNSVFLSCSFGFYFFFRALPRTTEPLAVGVGRWEYYSTTKQNPTQCEPSSVFREDE
jgi:hypothetical protein